MRSPPGVNMLGEELSAWNTVFEQRVAERTEEVTATSHRLEAEVTERRRAHARPTEANAELTALVDELRRLNDQIGQLAAMSNLLQSATDRAAACEVIARLAPTLFDGTSGAVYVLLDLGEQARAVGPGGHPGGTPGRSTPTTAWPSATGGHASAAANVGPAVHTCRPAASNGRCASRWSRTPRCSGS